jgi:hypothetical protein
MEMQATAAIISAKEKLMTDESPDVHAFCRSTSPAVGRGAGDAEPNGIRSDRRHCGPRNRELNYFDTC